MAHCEVLLQDGRQCWLVAWQMVPLEQPVAGELPAVVGVTHWLACVELTLVGLYCQLSTEQVSLDPEVPARPQGQ